MVSDTGGSREQYVVVRCEHGTHGSWSVLGEQALGCCPEDVSHETPQADDTLCPARESLASDAQRGKRRSPLSLFLATSGRSLSGCGPVAALSGHVRRRRAATCPLPYLNPNVALSGAWQEPLG